MKRIQIVISAEWRDPVKLEDHAANGEIAIALKEGVSGIFGPDADDRFTVSDPLIVDIHEPRAPRADKGKKRAKEPTLPLNPQPREEVVQHSSPVRPNVTGPDQERRDNASAPAVTEANGADSLDIPKFLQRQAERRGTA